MGKWFRRPPTPSDEPPANEGQIFYDREQRRRVVIFERADGFYTYKEEYYGDEELEMYWLPVTAYYAGIYDSAETALREAKGNVEWLRAQGEASP